MGQFDRLDHDCFRQLVAAAFHHHDGIGCSGHDQLQIAGLENLQRRIDHKLTVRAADLHSRNGPFERDIRQGQRRRSGRHADHIG